MEGRKNLLEQLAGVNFVDLGVWQYASDYNKLVHFLGGS